MNSKTSGRRPKLVLYPSRTRVPQAGADRDDFLIYASYRGTKAAGFFGTLRVVRKTDNRLWFPFDGGGDIGPFLMGVRMESSAAGDVPGAHNRINPPSTTSVCPVTKRASSLVRNATGPAMSAGVPRRLIACVM
jgi:hypothetical protein